MNNPPMVLHADATSTEAVRSDRSGRAAALPRSLADKPVLKCNERVRRALDDLANECFFKLLGDLGEVVIDDPQGSLCTTLRELEKSYRRASGEAFNAFAPDERSLLELHVGQGLTCSQIAARMGVAREAVLYQLVRIYARLKTESASGDLLGLYRGE